MANRRCGDARPALPDHNRANHPQIEWVQVGNLGAAMNPPKKSKPTPEVKLIRTLHGNAEARGEIIVEEQRGFLHAVTFLSLSDKGKRLPHFPAPWAIFDIVCQEMREILEQHDLPTDKTPIVPKKLDVFEERLCDDDELWYYDVFHSTESLSQPRLAGNLLRALTKLGQRDGIGDYILEFCSAMLTYGELRVSQVNFIATAGAAAASGRAAGPPAKSKKREAIRRIVWRRAEECWRSFPKYLGHAESTASEIAPFVNADLVAAGLASKADRSIKTIGDDIRAGRDAKVFPSWPIRRDV